MQPRIEASRACSDEEWDRAWARCPYATYFNGRDWAEAWSGYTGGRLRPAPSWLRYSDGTEVVVPLCRRPLLGGLSHRAFASPAGTYGGWLADGPLTEAHAQVLFDWLRRRNPNLQWRQNPYAPADGGADWQQDATQALDLSPDEATLIGRWNRGHRSAIGKALRSGIEISSAETPSDWDAYYEAYLDSRRRWGERAGAPYGNALFDALRQRAESGRNVVLWLARRDGAVVAGALCLYSPRIAVYWHGAALASHFESRPVNLLFHHVILDAKARGIAWFDFNPSGGHQGVEEFKRGFGTQRLPAGVLATESLPVRLLGSLRSRLPRRTT